MRTTRAMLAAPVLVLWTCLSGCASRGLLVDEYILVPALEESAAPVPGAPVDPVIGVGPIGVPAYLRRPHIVTRGPAGRLVTVPEERWGESLGDGFARMLAAGLERLVPSQRVYVEPAPTAAPTDYVVMVQIQRFEPAADGSIELDALWALHRESPGLKDRRALQRESIREPVSADTTEARVVAMSRAVEELAARMATQIRAALADRARHE